MRYKIIKGDYPTYLSEIAVHHSWYVSYNTDGAFPDSLLYELEEKHEA